MLPNSLRGERGTRIVLLHSFGTSRLEWEAVATALSHRHRTAALDLPGFGDARDLGAMDVACMMQAIEPALDEPCILVGHSMSGKMALALTRSHAAVQGLVLVAPSPPGPEPMSESARTKMLGQHDDDESAGAFVDANTFERLPAPLRERAVADVRRSSPEAWRAWLTTGSQEDWSERIGVLEDRAVLLVCGTQDTSLGENVQRRHTLPHVPQAKTIRVGASGHLVPLERPDELAEVIALFVADCNQGAS